MSASHTLIERVKATISTDDLEALIRDLSAFINTWFTEYSYAPRDPPYKRRGPMLAMCPVTIESLCRFIIFVLLRGGNPRKAMKNLDEKVLIYLQMIMTQMKVKGFSSDGKYTTWQWMTSFWDYTVVLCQLKPELMLSYFKVGPYVYKPVMPEYCYMIGGLHLLRGVSDDVKNLIMNEVFRHQHFLIFCKNELDPKKAKFNADNDNFKANRLTQVQYYMFQLDDSATNFPQKEIDLVRTLLKFDIEKIIKGLPKYTADYVNKPYEADPKEFRIKY